MKRWICRSGAMPDVVHARMERTGESAGIRILFAVDLHYGQWLGDGPMEALVRLMAGQRADLILLGGDLAEGRAAQEALCRLHLKRLSAPMGVFCVPGNNDCEAMQGDYALYRKMLGEAGVRLLVNEQVVLPVQGGRLVISGLDESKYGHPDPGAARFAARENDFHILLTHSPWALDPVLSSADVRVDLALCGHTHGGQIALGNVPCCMMGYRRASDRKYFFMTGDHMVDGTRVIVSNGVGCSLLPVRVAAPPQLYLIQC